MLLVACRSQCFWRLTYTFSVRLQVLICCFKVSFKYVSCVSPNSTEMKHTLTGLALLYYCFNTIFFLQSTLQTVSIRSRSVHRVPGPGWQFDASSSSALLLGEMDSSLLFGPFTLLLALFPLLTVKEKTMDFNKANIPQHKELLEKIHSGHVVLTLQQIWYRSMDVIPLLLPSEQHEDYFLM